ncbi:MAG: RluA family pseudouridine synthase [Verrucomicrobiia bacterium]
MNTLSPFSSNAPLGKGVQVIVEDPQGLIALSKPVGVLSHPNQTGEEQRSLIKAAYSLDEECFTYRNSKGEDERVWLLNRLDSATSGIILLARTEALAVSIRKHFKARKVKKIYAALVFGRPLKPKEVWQDRMSVTRQRGQIRTDSGAGHIPSEAHMQLVQTNTNANPIISLIQLDPKTGRSHQLRVQCRKHQLPIVGDATYGEFKLNRAYGKKTGRKRLFLHSFRTSFSYEWEGETHEFSAQAELPDAFNEALTS